MLYNIGSKLMFSSLSYFSVKASGPSTINTMKPFRTWTQRQIFTIVKIGVWWHLWCNVLNKLERLLQRTDINICEAYEHKIDFICNYMFTCVCQLCKIDKKVISMPFLFPILCIIYNSPILNKVRMALIFNTEYNSSFDTSEYNVCVWQSLTLWINSFKNHLVSPTSWDCKTNPKSKENIISLTVEALVP